MSISALRAIVAVVLMGHGLGHVLTALPVFGKTLSRDHSADSWLLSHFVGSGPDRAICLILNLFALLAFMSAGMALMGWVPPRGSWEKLTVLASMLSLLGLFLFWNAFPFLVPNKVGVIAVDGFALLSILLLRWPPWLFGD